MKLNRIFSFVTAITLLFGGTLNIPMTYSADIPEQITSQTDNDVTSGYCGSNLTWNLNAEGTLTISGTGVMQYYYTDLLPWVNKTIKKSNS